MLPSAALLASLAALLAAFEPCFTAPTFRTFCFVVVGLVAQTGRRTVCDMLVGAGLSRVWGHDRAHQFFSAARWSPEHLGVCLAGLIVSLLVAVDDTLFQRSGKYDVGGVVVSRWVGSVPEEGRLRQQLGDRQHPAGLPMAARLVVKNTTSVSRLWMARRMVENLPPRAARPKHPRRG